MQIASLIPWLIAVGVAATAAGAISLAVRVQREARSRKAKALQSAQTSRFIAQLSFDFAELPAIRALLGQKAAAALFERFSDLVLQCAELAQPVSIGSDSILVDFSVANELEANLLAQTLRQRLSQPISVLGIDFRLSVQSTLVSFEPQWEVEPQAHRFGPSSINAIGPRSRTELGENHNLLMLSELWKAMEANKLALAYQPKLDLRSEGISSVEALLRWPGRDAETIVIGDLIELLEKTGTIRAVTIWAIRRAISDGEKLLQVGFHKRIFVNVSGGLLADHNFVDFLLTETANTRVDIGIEITETSVISDPASALENLKAIAKTGIAIAIDDFGVGLSSLEYLQQLPASELKIDRNFIAKLSSSNRNPLIVKATIDLAHALEMKVTAEGVDDQLGVALLRVMGCDMVQGYLVSPALPIDELIPFLASHSASQSAGHSDATESSSKRA
jgi:diguanylate cyclase